MPFPTGDERNLGHVQLLQQFLRALDELLHDVIRKGVDNDGQPIFHEELLAPMREVIGELDWHFNKLLVAISETPDDRIHEHALQGPQLSFKLRVVRFFADRFAETSGPSQLRKLLDTLEGLLDSIIDAAGTGGAIKEYKDFVRNSTKD